MLGKISPPKECPGTDTVPGEAVEPPSLEVFGDHGDGALGGKVSGHGGDGMGLDLGVLEIFSNLNDSVILL